MNRTYRALWMLASLAAVAAAFGTCGSPARAMSTDEYWVVGIGGAPTLEHGDRSKVIADHWEIWLYKNGQPPPTFQRWGSFRGLTPEDVERQLQSAQNDEKHGGATAGLTFMNPVGPIAIFKPDSAARTVTNVALDEATGLFPQAIDGGIGIKGIINTIIGAGSGGKNQFFHIGEVTANYGRVLGDILRKIAQLRASAVAATDAQLNDLRRSLAELDAIGDQLRQETQQAQAAPPATVVQADVPPATVPIQPAPEGDIATVRARLQAALGSPYDIERNGVRADQDHRHRVDLTDPAIITACRGIDGDLRFEVNTSDPGTVRYISESHSLFWTGGIQQRWDGVIELPYGTDAATAQRLADDLKLYIRLSQGKVAQPAPQPVAPAQPAPAPQPAVDPEMKANLDILAVKAAGLPKSAGALSDLRAAPAPIQAAYARQLEAERRNTVTASQEWTRALYAHPELKPDAHIRERMDQPIQQLESVTGSPTSKTVVVKETRLRDGRVVSFVRKRDAWTGTAQGHWQLVSSTLLMRHDEPPVKSAADWAREAEAAFQAQRWADGERSYREALRLDPNNGLYCNQLGFALYIQARYAEALPWYEEGARLGPQYALRRTNVAQDLISLKRSAEAETYLRVAVTTFPGDATVRSWLGIALSWQSKWGAAEEQFREAIRLDANSGLYHASLAGMLLRQNRRDEALKEANEGIRLGYKGPFWAYTELGLNPSAAPTPQPASGQFKIEDLVVGTGATPQTGQRLKVHDVGWLTTGKQFDSSRERGQPFTFTLGKGQVIAGWEQGIIGMRVGGKRRLTIPPALAYGEHGAGDVIPPNSTLIFEIELLSIE